MADKTFLGGAAFNMAIDTKTHVDFVYRHHTVHRFHRPVTFLASDSGPYMRLMGELHEIGQRVDPIPANLERGLLVVSPCAGYRRNATEQRAPVASDAALDGRNSRNRRPSSVLVTVLAGDFVDPGVDTVAKRNRLVNIRTCCPWSLRKSNSDNSARKKKQRNKD